MKIAIIGTGISGLVAARQLNSSHDITVFEARNRLGGHTHSYTVLEEDGMLAVDTGFIVFNNKTYPGFCALMDELGVASQETDMSFSVLCRDTGLEYNGTNLNALFAQRRNIFRPRFLAMVRDILRFNKNSEGLFSKGDDQTTIRQHLAQESYSSGFINEYLIPLGASLWSCPAETFLDFPLLFLLTFLRNHGMATVNDRPQWRVICGGSSQYLEKLTEDFASKIRLNTPVLAVQRRAGRIQLMTKEMGVEEFDHIIFACHSDQALKILGDARPLEKEILGALPYQNNEVVLHTDSSILPRKKLAWASWNYHLDRKTSEHATLTYNMNILQRLKSKNTYCVTLNNTEFINPEKIIDTFSYAHPIYSIEGFAAQKRHAEISHQHNTSFCGAYWGNGFHEDGVQSALRVVAELEKRCPA